MITHKIPADPQEDQHIERAMETILSTLGEDMARPGLRETPRRVAQSLRELTSGNRMRPADVVGGGIFPSESSGMILQKDIEFFSLCEHHLLPFYGHMHVAYLPDKKIIGLSKIGRIIDIFARRLQVQENLTHQIAHSLNELIEPKGVAVLVEANHFCMMMRGVKKQGALTVTSEYLGTFAGDHALRTDFLHAAKK